MGGVGFFNLGVVTCKVLVEPITSLLQLVWNDVMMSCLSAGFTHSSVETHTHGRYEEVTYLSEAAAGWKTR